MTLQEAVSGVPWTRPPVGEEERGLADVNITLYSATVLRGSMSGRARNLEEAVCDAVRRAATGKRYGRPIAPSEVPLLRIDLWVRVSRERLAVPGALETVDLGLHGVELRVRRRSAYYKPSVALASRVTDVNRLMDNLSRKARVPANAWRDTTAEVWRTTWEHFVDTPGANQRPIRLRRLRPLGRPTVNRAEVQRAAKAAQDRLMCVQDMSGYYAYCYLPLADRFLNGPENLVRQAGCSYAAAWSAEHESDLLRKKALRKSASAAVIRLLDHRQADPYGGFYLDDQTSAAKARRGKLGAGALALLALQYDELDSTYAATAGALLRGIAARQNQDGSFRCYADTRSVSDDGRSQNYFPGEALLAIARLARRRGRPADVDTDRAFAWYSGLFRRAPDPAFVMWHAAAWRTEVETAVAGGELTPQVTRQARFVLEIVDWLLARQLGRGACHPDMVGGFATGRRNPGCATATFTEAVIHGFAVASVLEDKDRMRRYRDAAHLGLSFVFRLQISPETAMLFPNPRCAVGGTTRSLGDLMIRCDQDQHTITAMLAALEAPGLIS